MLFGTMGGGEPAKKSRISVKGLAGRYMLVLLIIVLVVFSFIINQKFLSATNINSVLSYVAIYGFASVGQAMCMLVGEMNLALGATASLAPILGIKLGRIIYSAMGLEFVRGGIYFSGNYAIVAVVSILSGILIGWLIMFLTQKLRVPSMIVTLGFYYALDGLSYVLEPMSINLFGTPGVGLLSQSGIGPVPFGFIIFLLFTFGLGFLMKFTKFGSCIYATGGSAKAATYAGINVKRWKMVAFLICGFCAGMAGLLFSDRLGTIKPLTGQGLEFYGIAIAAIAGVSITGEGGHISRVILSSAIFYLIINLLNFWGIAVYWRNIFIGIIIIITAIQQIRERDKLRMRAEVV